MFDDDTVTNYLFFGAYIAAIIVILLQWFKVW